VNPLEEIFKQYSTPIIIVLVVLALIAIFALLLSTDTGGVVMQQFKDLLTSFFKQANDALGGWNPPTPN
jgi:hypothetical protein